MNDLEIRIRKYSKEDESAIREICCDTGFWGKPIDRIFQDREIFADLIVKPYLKIEPEHTFVAEHDGKIVGYLNGYLGNNFELSSSPIFLHTLSKMLFKYLSGKYNKRSKEFVKWSLFKSLKSLPKHPKDTAHLHFNLKEGYHGLNIGKKLINTYEEMLKRGGMNSYYGEVLSSNSRRTEYLYSKLGFNIYDKKRTTVFEPEIKEHLYLMCIYKKL